MSIVVAILSIPWMAIPGKNGTIQGRPDKGAASPTRRTPAIRTNFHSHTARCQHAIGQDEEYVLAALDAGFSQMGFSDHSPWPYGDDYVSGIRMPLSQFQDYLDSARALRERYQDRISLYIGLEAEYYPRYHSWLKEQAQAQRLDFLILGSHFDNPEEADYFGSITSPEGLARYAAHTIKGMQTGLFCALAHPDLFMMNYPRFDSACAAISRDLCRAAKALGIPLEYNLSGLYPQAWRRGMGYPANGFWDIAAEEGVSAIIGLDAHSPARYADTHLYDQARQKLSGMGILLVDSLVPCPGIKRLAV